MIQIDKNTKIVNLIDNLCKEFHLKSEIFNAIKKIAYNAYDLGVNSTIQDAVSNILSIQKRLLSNQQKTRMQQFNKKI